MAKSEAATPKLRKCPFCGKIPKDLVFGESEHGPYVICTNCLGDGPPPSTQFIRALSSMEKVDLEAQAIKAWNRRA